jgi:hypothetical protein
MMSGASSLVLKSVRSEAARGGSFLRSSRMEDLSKTWPEPPNSMKSSARRVATAFESRRTVGLRRCSSRDRRRSSICMVGLLFQRISLGGYGAALRFYGDGANCGSLASASCLQTGKAAAWSWLGGEIRGQHLIVVARVCCLKIKAVSLLEWRRSENKQRPETDNDEYRDSSLRSG